MITTEQILEFFKKNPHASLSLRIQDYIKNENLFKDRSKFYDLTYMYEGAPYVRIYKASSSGKICIYPVYYCI